MYTQNEFCAKITKRYFTLSGEGDYCVIMAGRVVDILNIVRFS